MCSNGGSGACLYGVCFVLGGRGFVGVVYTVSIPLFALPCTYTSHAQVPLPKHTQTNTHPPKHTVGANREESHALHTPIDEVAEGAQYVCINRGDITVHNERVIHGSGPNLSTGWRKAYVLAYRYVIICCTVILHHYHHNHYHHHHHHYHCGCGCVSVCVGMGENGVTRDKCVCNAYNSHRCIMLLWGILSAHTPGYWYTAPDGRVCVMYL